MTGERRLPEWSHGTHSMYCKGCRCDVCREAHRVHMRRSRSGHTKTAPKPWGADTGKAFDPFWDVTKG